MIGDDDMTVSLGDYMKYIGINICAGGGGWLPADFGTVFGQCLRQ
jgi:hypothetical protein